MCDWAGKDWRQHLDMAEFVVNGSASSVTGMTPFLSQIVACVFEGSMPASRIWSDRVRGRQPSKGRVCAWFVKA
jgi:hypothetical protein